MMPLAESKPLAGRERPADLPEKIWEIFAHGGDFRPADQEPFWELVGLQDIPAGLLAILESPAYAPHVLESAAEEKHLNSEAEALHEQLYGNVYYPPALRHQLLKRYQAIGAKYRIRGLYPGSSERRNVS